jgi:hypothetical protein
VAINGFRSEALFFLRGRRVCFLIIIRHKIRQRRQLFIQSNNSNVSEYQRWNEKKCVKIDQQQSNSRRLAALGLEGEDKMDFSSFDGKLGP